MPLIQRIAIALLAFSLAGFGLMSLQPAESSNTPAPNGYALAISTGTGLWLQDSSIEGAASAVKPAQRPMKLGAAAGEHSPQLACEAVIRLGLFDVGTRCVSHGWEVSIDQ